jgi:site-specific recombinase XerD
MKTVPAAPLWRAPMRWFFDEYVTRHRGFSPCTIASYRTAFAHLLGIAAIRDARPDALEPRTVLDFLAGLESERGNSAATRNQRLAALKCFWQAMQAFDPERREAYARLLAIPAKRAVRRAPDYLEPDEMRRLLERADAGSSRGFRDHLLLRWAYQTGARVSEIAATRTSWLRLDRPPHVELRGKGGKTRIVPLLDGTAAMVSAYLRNERPQPRPGYEDHLFLTRRGRPFTRQGLWKVFRGHFDGLVAERASLRGKRLAPHSLRHTTAVFLLRAGVEMNVIKARLGHADVATTSGYLDLDLDMKRDALQRFARMDLGGAALPSTGATTLPEDVVAWLEQL